MIVSLMYTTSANLILSQGKYGTLGKKWSHENSTKGLTSLILELVFLLVIPFLCWALQLCTSTKILLTKMGLILNAQTLVAANEEGCVQILTKINDMTMFKYHFYASVGGDTEAYGSWFVYVCMYLSAWPSVCLSAGFLFARWNIARNKRTRNYFAPYMFP